MRISKKILVSILIAIVVILGVIPTNSYAELTDEQRKLLVDNTYRLMEAARNTGVLRYSQAHRTSGVNWTKVRSHVKQTGGSMSVTLTKDDVDRVNKALTTPQREFSMTGTKYSFIPVGGDIYDTYAFDCSSLCVGMYQMSFGVTFSSVYNTAVFKAGADGNFKVTKGIKNAKPGDLLLKRTDKSGHIGIYLGDIDNDGKDEYAHAAGVTTKTKTNAAKVAISKAMADYLIKHPTQVQGHPRYEEKNVIKLEVPAEYIRNSNYKVLISQIDETTSFTHCLTYQGPVKQLQKISLDGVTTVNTGITTPSGNSSRPQTVQGEDGTTTLVLGTGTGSLNYWPADFRLDDQALKNSEGFFHKGTPAYGGYTINLTVFTWLNEKASDVYDYVVGLITGIFRMAIVGWTSIIEKYISEAISFGTEDMNKVKEPTTNEDKSTWENLKDITTATKRVTVEDIIFNAVPVLDINFFNYETAAGQDLSPNSIIYKLREAIANWYYVLRTLVIMLMLVILIYGIVRTIFTTVASDLAEAKRKLIDWVVGFIIVFVIHYFMIGVIAINNNVVEILKPGYLKTTQQENKTDSQTENNELSLYEQIRIQAYDVRALTGWAGTIMYVAMVAYLVFFIALYVKRLFILIILTIISPFVGALYAFNKKKYKLRHMGTRVCKQCINPISTCYYICSFSICCIGSCQNIYNTRFNISNLLNRIYVPSRKNIKKNIIIWLTFARRIGRKYSNSSSWVCIIYKQKENYGVS